MKTIYKYRLIPYVAIQMPKGSKIISIAEQQAGEVFIWAQVDTTQPLEERNFIFFTTGIAIESEELLDFYGTVHLRNGLVFHVFEEKQIRN